MTDETRTEPHETNPVRLYMSPREAALALGVHEDSIYRACAANQLPYVRVGRQIRLHRSLIETGQIATVFGGAKYRRAS